MALTFIYKGYGCIRYGYHSAERIPLITAKHKTPFQYIHYHDFNEHHFIMYA